MSGRTNEVVRARKLNDTRVPVVLVEWAVIEVFLDERLLEGEPCSFVVFLSVYSKPEYFDDQRLCMYLENLHKTRDIQLGE